MSTEQLNLRVPSALADRLRTDAFERRVLPRDVIVELLEAKYGQQVPEPIDGQLSVEDQLTVDEAAAGPGGENPSVLTGVAPGGPVASRRPRAAEQAERPDGQPAGDDMALAGCPECGGEFQDIEQEPYQQCEDCGFKPWGNARA